VDRGVSGAPTGPAAGLTARWPYPPRAAVGPPRRCTPRPSRPYGVYRRVPPTGARPCATAGRTATTSPPEPASPSGSHLGNRRHGNGVSPRPPASDVRGTRRHGYRG